MRKEGIKVGVEVECMLPECTKCMSVHGFCDKHWHELPAYIRTAIFRAWGYNQANYHYFLTEGIKILL